MPPLLIDAHNHLQDERLDAVREDWLRAAPGAGVAAMVVNGTHEGDWPRVLDLARRSPLVIPSFGLHPWWVGREGSDWFDALRRHLDAVPSAVGEIGLDRWIPDPDLPRQEEVFLRQWREAAARSLPVTVHCLRHWGRLLELLRAEPAAPRGFLLHSYGGPAEMVPAFAALGAYFSISGSFFRPGRESRLEVFRRVPADRLLVETDAPDMIGPGDCVVHPLPPDDRGAARNHPGNLARIQARTAAWLGEEPGALARRLAVNFHKWMKPSSGPVFS